MKKWNNVTYASVYNYLFKNRKCCTKSSLCKLGKMITKGKKIDDRTLYWLSKHVLKIYETQSIGEHISRKEREKLRIIHANASLNIRLRLRQLQHKAIEYMWRPDGVLFNNMKNEYSKSINNAANESSNDTPDDGVLAES